MSTFTGNPALLIAAPMLQDAFVDKDGSPMSAGIVTCYQDNSRTTLKNWYYQSSNFADNEGQYSFSALPNPLTLSAAGTICDINGVDTIPFFYPVSENDETVPQPYYITIVNAASTNQITRPNFPYNPSDLNPQAEGSVQNYIINNVFWRNAGTVNLTNVTQMVVCPSQHDGFQYPDIQFIKTNTSGDDTLTFTQFPESASSALTGDITPEFYINHACSNTPTGETQKCYQFPISLHLATLNGVGFTLTIQAQNMGGSGTGQNVINLFILQDTGTGTTPPAAKLIQTITLNPGWTKYTFTNTFPVNEGLTLSGAGNDAFYLQVQMPLNASCSINFTRPSLYLNSSAPTNDFSTYDQIDAVINSPRVGDMRQTLNSFSPFGWVPMNDGSIGSAASAATTRNNIDTWALYRLIYTAVLNNWAPVSGGRTAPGNTTAAAYTDFTGNKTLTLPRALGRVLMGENGATTTPQTFTTNYAGSHFNLTVTASGQYPTGTPVQVTNSGGALPSNLAANTVYYVINVNATTIELATTLDNAYAGTHIDIGSDSTGTSTVQNALGAYVGESAHVLVKAELPDPLTTTADMVNATVTGGAVPLIKGDTSYSTGAVSNQGGNQGHNTVQPSTLMNIFVKL
jgi:hypothetical protein